MRHHPASLRAAVVAASFALGGCQLGSSVVRIHDGEQVPGRWISPTAYTSFLEGSLAEAGGNREAAAVLYQRAIDDDPEASEAWSRLGAVRCTTDRGRANAAFSRAETLEPTLSALWIARAECHLERQDPRRAVEDAARGLALGPRDPEASQVFARALDAIGEAERAAQVRRALALIAPLPSRVDPNDVIRRGDDAEPTVDHALSTLDEAGIATARIRAHLSLAALALKAVRAGRTDVADHAATIALRAEPGNTDALVAILAASDLKQEDLVAFEKWARALPVDRTPPSALARELMGELLSRRVGREAARAWAEASETNEATPSSKRSPTAEK
jgi:tetratricopeptide (TPR) repeat protein